MTNVAGPSARPIRVGLIGYGLGGSAFHAPFIATTPGLQLAAVVTRDDARRREVAARYPSARVVDDVDALLRDDADVELVVVSTPNRLHHQLAVQAIDAGRHVVVDKPMVPTAAEARALSARAHARGVVLAPFMNRRWDGDFQTLRALIADGALGEPTRLESRFERWRPTPSGGWREREEPGEAGGTLFDLGSHLVDQALVLFGPVAGVYAELDRRRAGAEVDDDAFVALTHASGARSHLHMSAVAAQEGPRFRLLGTRGAFTKWGLDVQEAALRAGAVPSGPGWGVEPAAAHGLLGVGVDSRRVPTIRGDYGAFYRGLVAAVREGAPPPVSPLDAVAGLTVIEAARDSARRGAVVRL
jgi:scyllo-inositol 2-dehydrogenase (NADP+)